MVAIAGIAIRAICSSCRTRSPKYHSGSDDEVLADLLRQGWSLDPTTSRYWDRHLCPGCNGNALALATVLAIVAAPAER